MTRRWTKGDERRVRELFARRPLESLAREFECKPEAVLRFARRVFGVVKPPRSIEDRIEAIRPYVGVATVEEIEVRTGLTPQMQTPARSRMLGDATSDAPLTHEELREFKMLYGCRDDVYLRMVYGRSAAVIEATAEQHRLAKDKGARTVSRAGSVRMPRWSDDTVAKLKSMYATASNLEIAHALGRSVKSVVSKASRLGLKKDISRLREMGRENVKRRYE